MLILVKPCSAISIIHVSPCPMDIGTLCKYIDCIDSVTESIQSMVSDNRNDTFSLLLLNVMEKLHTM